MGRQSGITAAINAALGVASLRQYWQEINREAREAKAQERAAHKARDQRRPKCLCKAYPWPHRPRGGLCRYPDPPTERWKPKRGYRPYRKRYTGLRRQLARANRLHPIRDRAAIDAMMRQVIAAAKQLHRVNPKFKYRNMLLADGRLIAHWTPAGPDM